MLCSGQVGMKRKPDLCLSIKGHRIHAHTSQKQGWTHKSCGPKGDSSAKLKKLTAHHKSEAAAMHHKLPRCPT
jgi:hypothetical protein